MMATRAEEAHMIRLREKVQPVPPEGAKPIEVHCKTGIRKNGLPCHALLLRGFVEGGRGHLEIKCPKCDELTYYII